MRKDRYGVQLDLFRPMPARPTWQALPQEVAQRAQQLLARLLQEHLAGCPAPRSEIKEVSEPQEASNER